jgi:[protein-PII] uridylyltransferase
MPYATQVNIHQASQGIYHRLEIVAGDRPGLLAKIAFTFLQLGIDLHNAKINTLGNRAEDSFLISAKQQALNAAQIDALRDNLVKL